MCKVCGFCKITPLDTLRVWHRLSSSLRLSTTPISEGCIPPEERLILPLPVYAPAASLGSSPSLCLLPLLSNIVSSPPGHLHHTLPPHASSSLHCRHRPWSPTVLTWIWCSSSDHHVSCHLDIGVACWEKLIIPVLEVRKRKCATHEMYTALAVYEPVVHRQSEPIWQRHRWMGHQSELFPVLIADNAVVLLVVKATLFSWTGESCTTTDCFHMQRRWSLDWVCSLLYAWMCILHLIRLQSDALDCKHTVNSIFKPSIVVTIYLLHGSRVHHCQAKKSQLCNHRQHCVIAY